MSLAEMGNERRREELLPFVNALPERERAVLLLYYYEGLDLPQIADRSGVSEAQVARIHTKAIIELRDSLPPGEGTAP